MMHHLSDNTKSNVVATMRGCIRAEMECIKNFQRNKPKRYLEFIKACQTAIKEFNEIITLYSK